MYKHQELRRPKSLEQTQEKQIWQAPLAIRWGRAQTLSNAFREPTCEAYVATVQGKALRHVAKQAAELAVRVRHLSAAADVQIVAAKGYAIERLEHEEVE